MDKYNLDIVAKVELYENIINGIIDKENLILINESDINNNLLNTIWEFFERLRNKVSLDYIQRLVEEINTFIPLNKNFYIKLWEFISRDNTTDNPITFLEDIYNTGKADVSVYDWNNLLCLLIKYLFLEKNLDMEKIIKYKNELKENIKTENS